MKNLHVLLLALVLLPLSTLRAQTAGTWQSFTGGGDITSFTEDGTNYYVASKAGLLLVDKTSGEVQHLMKHNSPLPSNQVEAVARATDGSIWVGTYDNGIAIISPNRDWRFITRENSNLPGNDIQKLVADSQGNVWACTSEHMIKFEDEKMEVYALPLDSWKVLSMCVNPTDGEVWMLRRESVEQFDGGTIITHDSFEIYPDLQEVVADGEGNVWVLSPRKISKYNGQAWTHLNPFDIPGTGSIMGISVNASGHVVLLRKESMVEMTANGWQVQNFNTNGLPHFYKAGLIHDESGTRWVSIEHNLYQWEGNQWKEFSTANAPFEWNRLLHSTSAGSKTWLMDAYSDIYQYDVATEEWTSIPAPAGLYLDGSTRLKVHPDGRLIASSAQGGLYIYDGHNWDILNENNSSLPSNQIACLEIDVNGNIWAGTYDKGIARLSGNTITVFGQHNTILPSDKIAALTSDSKGTLWVATQSGHLLRYDGTDWEKWDMTTVWGMQMDNIRALATDANDELWIGHDSHPLVHFDGNTFTTYPSGHVYIPSSRILSMEFDEKGTLWMGTVGNGLLSLHEGKFEFYTYYSSPLLDGYILSLSIDGEGNVWMGTNKGVSMLQTEGAASIAPREATQLQVAVYPNPATEVAHLTYSTEKAGEVEVSLWNSRGQMLQQVLRAEQQPGQHQVQVALDELPAGLYIVRLTTPGGQAAARVMVATGSN